MLHCNIKPVNVAVRKKAEAAKVFFFFPFGLEPASPGVVHHKPLPMLPAPMGRRLEEPVGETAFADAVAQAGYLATGLLRHVLISITSSLTALGSQANLFFSQVAAALAFDRMVRQAAPFTGIGWPAAGPYSPPQIWAAGLWTAPFQYPALYSPTAIPPWPANLWANPWCAVAEAFAAWANIWEPAIVQCRPMPTLPGGRPPFATTLSIPGWSWGVTIG